jgi:hypothetical protein
VKHSKFIEHEVNSLWRSFYKDSPAQARGQKRFKARMAEFIKDERLLKGTQGLGENMLHSLLKRI